MDATESGGVSGHGQTSTLPPTATGQPFSGQVSAGGHQPTEPTQAVSRNTRSQSSQATVSSKSAKSQKGQKVTETKMPKISLQAKRRKHQRKQQQRVAKEKVTRVQSKDNLDDCLSSDKNEQIDPAETPLPEELSDVEMLAGSLVDIQPGTSQQISVATGHIRLESVDSQRARDDADSGDDVLITHISPMKSPRTPILGSQQSLMTSEGQVLQGHLRPAYLKSANVVGGLVSSAPSGFDTIKGVKLVRPGVSDAPKTGVSPSQYVVEVLPRAKTHQETTMTSSEKEQSNNQVTETVGENQSPQNENATAEVVDSLSAVTISGHKQESSTQASSLGVQGTEVSQLGTVESETGDVLAIGHTELLTVQAGPDQNSKESTVSPVSQTEQNIPMNVDGVEHSKTEENIEAEASQMESGSTQATEMENIIIGQGMDTSALTEGQIAQLWRALQKASRQGPPETFDQPIQDQTDIGPTQPEGEAEGRLWQREGFPLAMAVSSPKGRRQDILADSAEMNKSLESQDIETTEKAQMETDDREKQDTKMEIGSNNDKEAEQWSSGEEPGVEGDKTDRSYSMPSQEKGTDGENLSPQKETKSPHPDKIERARRVREHDCQFPPTELFITHKPDEDDDPAGWYQGEDCANPNVVAMASNKMALPTPDGALSGNGKEPLPGPGGRTRYRDRSLERRLKWPRSKPDSEGYYSDLPKKEQLKR